MRGITKAPYYKRGTKGKAGHRLPSLPRAAHHTPHHREDTRNELHIRHHQGGTITGNGRVYHMAIHNRHAQYVCADHQQIGGQNMVTKDQAIKAGEGWGRTEFHYGTCTRTVGPEGGVTIKRETWRSNGKCKTWKRRPDKFMLPIKYGLRDCWYLNNYNAQDFHLASECPLDREGEV